MALEVLREWPHNDETQFPKLIVFITRQISLNIQGVVCSSVPAGGYSTATVYKHRPWTHSNHKEKNDEKKR